MKNILFRRSLVCGIILLFIGMSVTSSINGDIEKISNQSTEESNTSLLNNGLSAYWNFDEGEGDTAHDSSGHGYDGIIHGASWTTDTPSGDGYALDFDGEDDYVDLDAYSENLGFNKTDNYIISAWINSTSTDGMIYSMSHSTGTRVYAHLELNSDGFLSFKVGTEGCIINLSSDDAYNDGSWHHVKIMFYGDDIDPTVELYVDNVLEGSVTEWLCPITSDEFKTAKIGRRSNNETNYFDGVIDEVKVYKYPGGILPPNAPTIDGETSGKVRKEYEYTFNATDPDGDDVKYFIDWGDNTSEWTGYNSSGTDVKVKHTWSKRGTYIIRAKAKDIDDAESDWGYLEVEMPVNYEISQSSSQHSSSQNTMYFTTKALQALEINITKPEKCSFYLQNEKLFPLIINTIIYGPIDIEVNASSEAGIEKVEFYINNKSVFTDDEAPYSYEWKPILCGPYTIKVIAYDNAEQNASAEIKVLKWRIHPLILLASTRFIFRQLKTGTPFQWTILRGTVFNLKQVGDKYHARAIRLHYTEIAPFSSICSTGTIKLRKITFAHVPFMLIYDLGPVGLTSYIFGIFPGKVSELPGLIE